MIVAKILVVDDEFGIGELLREVLSDDDHVQIQRIAATCC